MVNLLEQLQIIIPLTSFLFLIILTSIHVFFKIRRRFPIKVNCWFCNKNAYVPYDNANSWECTSCEQYNGFTADGDYNKEIPAQRITKLNTSKNSSFSDTKSVKHTQSNGLCEHCNRNQELKMQQLASFIPSDVDNFDEEVEEFKNHLEQSYRLCPRCERILKRTLNKVKNNILGSKLSQLGGKGLKFLDQHMSSNSQSISKHRIFFSKCCYYGLILLSITNFISIAKSIEISKDRLESVLSNKVAHAFLLILFYIVALKQTFVTIWSYLLNISMMTKVTNYISIISKLIYLTITSNKINIFKEDNNFDIHIDFLLQTLGIVFSICLVLTQNSKNLLHILVLLLWNVGQYMPVFKIHCGNYLNDVLLDVLMVVGSALTIILLHTHRNIMVPTIPTTMKLNNSFHRIYSECNSEISDDDSDIEIDLASSHVSTSSLNRSFRKSPLSNKSVISLDTTKSVSPSVFTNSVFRNHCDQSSVSNMKSMNSSMYRSSENVPPQDNTLNRSFRHLQQDYTRSNFGSTTNLNKSFGSQKSLTQTPVYNYSTCHHPFQSSVDSLDMNGIKLGPAQPNYPLQEQRMYVEAPKNPFSPELYEERSPSVCSIRQRNILTPSRLHMNNQMAASQSSWVAGGYWNTSPQKKVFQSPLPPLSVDFCPIFSRTSSQSSGFESHASSINNGCVDRNSRESSVCDDIERASVFSELIYNNFNKQKNANLLNNSFIEPQQMCPVLSRPSDHMFATPNTNSFMSQRAPSVNINNKNGYHEFRSDKNVRSFSLSNKSLNQSKIPKGRLLKDWIVKNNSMMSE